MLTGPRGSPLLDAALRYVPLVASLASLAVSIVALRHTGAARAEAPVDASPAAAPAPPEARPGPPSFAGSLRVAPRGIPGPRSSPVAAAARRVSADRSPGKPPSASVSALAAKLRVRADVLATLADASGDLPASLEARLLHAQEAGAEVASRAKLGAAAGDTIANILVDYVLRTQREAPDNEAQPDQDGLAVLKDDALSAIRAAAGPDAERVAAGMIGQL